MHIPTAHDMEFLLNCMCRFHPDVCSLCLCFPPLSKPDPCGWRKRSPWLWFISLWVPAVGQCDSLECPSLPPEAGWLCAISRKFRTQTSIKPRLLASGRSGRGATCCHSSSLPSPPHPTPASGSWLRVLIKKSSPSTEIFKEKKGEQGSATS